MNKPLILLGVAGFVVLACQNSASLVHVGEDKHDVIAALGDPQWTEPHPLEGPLAPQRKDCRRSDVKSCLVYRHRFGNSLLVYLDSRDKVACVEETGAVFQVVTP